MRDYIPEVTSNDTCRIRECPAGIHYKQMNDEYNMLQMWWNQYHV